jgi:hypothetical protein
VSCVWAEALLHMIATTHATLTRVILFIDDSGGLIEGQS